MILLGELAFYLLLEVAMYSVGRLVIPLLSFGRARAMRPREVRHKEAGGATAGQLLLPPWAASVTGVLTLIAALVVYAHLA